MFDEIHDRTYRDGRDQFHADIDRGLAKIGKGLAVTFQAVKAIQFAAPWRKRSSDVSCA